MIVKDLAQAWPTKYTSKWTWSEAQQQQGQREEETDCLWLNVSRTANNCFLKDLVTWKVEESGLSKEMDFFKKWSLLADTWGQRLPEELSLAGRRESGHAPGVCRTSHTTAGGLKLEGSHSPLLVIESKRVGPSWSSVIERNLTWWWCIGGSLYRSEEEEGGLKQWRLFSLVLHNLIILSFAFPILSLLSRDLACIFHYCNLKKKFITNMILSFFLPPIIMLLAYLLHCYQSRYSQVHSMHISLKDVFSLDGY